MRGGLKGSAHATVISRGLAMTWKQMRFAANALLVTMAAVACSSSDPSDARLCSTDEDCGESYICESNICVPDSTPGDECLNGLIVDDVCVPCENGTTLQSGEC